MLTTIMHINLLVILTTLVANPPIT